MTTMRLPTGTIDGHLPLTGADVLKALRFRCENDPDRLHEELQARIRQASADRYDAYSAICSAVHDMEDLTLEEQSIKLALFYDEMQENLMQLRAVQEVWEVLSAALEKE